MIELLLPPLQRAALQIGTLLLVGTLAWKVVLQGAITDAFTTAGREDEGGALARKLERRVVRIALAVALGLVLVWALRLYVQLLGFRDPFVPLREDLDFLLTGTFWGTVWIAQGGIVLLLALALALLTRSASTDREGKPSGTALSLWAVVALATGALVLSLALSSHALSVESNRTLALAADALHTLAAGAWLGSLAIILTHAWRAPDPEGLAFAAQLRAFSPIALAAVPLLLLAGSVLSWHHLTLPGDLWRTGYGRILSAKVALVGVVLLFGFLNWRRGLPSLDAEPGRSSVRRQAAWELAVALLVLLLTAILTGAGRPGPG